MLTSVTFFQVVVFTVMAAFSVWSVFLITGALDCMVMLGRIKAATRRLERALRGDPKLREPGLARALAGMARRQTALAPLWNAFSSRMGDWEAAKTRFREQIELAVTVHLQNLARQGRMAGPLGLGFTVLALSVSLLGMVPSGGAANSHLMNALPVSLITTAAACFNVVLLNWTAGRLTRLAFEVAKTCPARLEAAARTRVAGIRSRDTTRGTEE